MEKNLLELIRNEKIDELRLCVFNQKLPDSSGNGTYTQVLSAEEETAFMEILLSKDGHKADKWLEFIQEYSRHYPVSNQAIHILLNNIGNPKSVPLLISMLWAFSYNESQGVALCNFVLENPQSPQALSVLQLIYEKARVFYPEVYRLLETIDLRIRESGYDEQACFAKSYMQSIENYRKGEKSNLPE